MTRQLDQFGPKFEEIDENLAEMDEELMTIKQRMEWMERETKKLNAVITGIREEEQEQICSKISELFANTLGTKEVTVEAEYRIRKKSEDRARPIKVKFRSLNDKNEVMAFRKKLKGTTIYVNNDMTKLEKENSKLLHKHFKDAKEKGRKAYYRK